MYRLSHLRFYDILVLVAIIFYYDYFRKEYFMPTPLPDGQNITVTHIHFKKGYQMDSMQMSTDHYNIGITLQGRRRTITPFHAYSFQAGDVALMPPHIYHRTLSEYDEPYERIMAKFSPAFAEPFIQKVGRHAFEQLYKAPVYHFSAATSAKIKHMFFDLLAEYEKDTPYKEFIMQGILYHIFTTILEEHIPEKSVIHPKLLSPQLLHAIVYMENHYKEQPSLEEVAHHVGFSAGYFSRLFHTKLGIPYNTYMNNIQLRHVQLLLSTTNMSIMDIAQETGYCHGEYLSAQFKKKVGITPSMYRRQCLAKKDTVYLPTESSNL